MLGLRKQEPASAQANYRMQVQAAMEAWKNAQNYFNNVSDPDLVDYAIYDLGAAQRRYMYMLKCARENE